MANDVVIRAEELGKKYVIGHQADRERYVALRDVVARSARTLRRKAEALVRGRSLTGDAVEEFWALKDVSFELKRGEVLGVIGINGAGKSTLLKILSRITEPSEGRVVIKGRVASLLEVGTGFHPELTGRENIYLNGAILGMSRTEIRRKFDEIVDFSGVEKFIDTPVKRYSSGMYVRLAFAVAAHLEPEILVIDEVLAVGDADFQKKCLGKISEVAGGGRTVLFVSHNMVAVKALCSRSIHFSAGKILVDGETSGVVSAYLQQSGATHHPNTFPKFIQDGLSVDQVAICPPDVRSNNNLDIKVNFAASLRGRIHECCLLIYSVTGVRLAVVDFRQSSLLPFAYEAGRFHFLTRIRSVPLVAGQFSVGLYLVTDHFSGDILELASFSISDCQKTAEFVPYPADVRGVVTLDAAISLAADRLVIA